MYYWPNSTTTAIDKAEIVAPLLSTIVRVNGAKDVTFSGFDFTETRATFLDAYVNQKNVSSPNTRRPSFFQMVPKPT